MNMERKVCTKCNVEKPLDEFYVDKRSKSGVVSSCKECFNFYQKKFRDNNKSKVKLRSKSYYENNKERALKKQEKYRLKNKEEILTKQRQYRNENCEHINKTLKVWKNNNREKVIESSKKYRKDNVEKVKEYRRKYRLENKSKIDNNRKKTQPLINLYLKNKRDSNPIYRLTVNMRGRLKSYLTIKNITKKNRTFDLVGCTPDFLKEHLERQFKDNMSWDNYGLHGWHIDHIIPLSSAKTEEEIYKLCYYTNLQPLWAEENIKKSNKLLKTI